ncbi:MAG TPA: hypothetical protein VGA53_01430 [Candidatus Paceibacterota bacterium]
MRIVFLFVLASVVMPGFAVAQEQPPMGVPVLEAPETLDEAKQGTLNILDKILAIGPGIIKNIWNTQAVPLWKDMWQWVSQELWQKRFQPIVQGLIDRGKELLGREVEKRVPLVERELQQEKQELAEELAQHGKSAGKSLWERFLDLFRTE